MERRRAGDPCVRMVLHVGLPASFPGRKIDGIHAGGQVAEVRGRPPVGIGSDRDRGADASVGLVDPVDAPRLRVQGVHEPDARAHECLSPCNGGLQGGGRDPREPEGPLERKVRDLAGGHPGRCRRLEPRVAVVGAPAVPGRTRQRVAGRCVLGTAVGRLRNLVERIAERSVRAAGDILRNGALLILAQPSCLPHHEAEGHRLVDAICRVLLDRRRRQDLRHVAVVAPGTVLRVDPLAIPRLRGRTDGTDKNECQDDGDDTHGSSESHDRTSR